MGYYWKHLSVHSFYHLIWLSRNETWSFLGIAFQHIPWWKSSWRIYNINFIWHKLINKANVHKHSRYGFTNLDLSMPRYMYVFWSAYLPSCHGTHKHLLFGLSCLPPTFGVLAGLFSLWRQEARDLQCLIWPTKTCIMLNPQGTHLNFPAQVWSMVPAICLWLLLSWRRTPTSPLPYRETLPTHDFTPFTCHSSHNQFYLWQKKPAQNPTSGVFWSPTDEPKYG